MKEARRPLSLKGSEDGCENHENYYLLDYYYNGACQSITRTPIENMIRCPDDNGYYEDWVDDKEAMAIILGRSWGKRLVRKRQIH